MESITLSYLINNAGITEVNELVNTRLMNQIIAINCIAPTLNSRFIKASTIINISSFIGGLHPSGYLALYADSKSFSRVLHESLY